MSTSRTKRTLQNSKVSLILFLIQIFVGFFSRKTFLNYLGDEVIGLNTTLGNILSFLNLAELGIGIAMATSLYKPIHDNDQERICEIITIQGYLYKRIAILICILSIPVLCTIPFIFPSTNCGITYVYTAYIVFLSGSLFSYLWNYRQILIQADQKNFKLLPWKHAVHYTKIFIQMALLLFTPLGIWGWIGAEMVGNLVTVFVINHVIYKEYPWFRSSSSNPKLLLSKYKDLIKKTKQLFIHKVSLFVLNQTSPLIIYSFVSLSMVTYYGNYMMLIGYALTLLKAIFDGMGASIGNLVSDNNHSHTLEVFWELFSSRVWISGIACFALYVSTGPFISIWLGEKYVLNNLTLILLILNMYITATRSVVESFKEAYQLFADIWAPIAEATINLSCSILFGYLWGLNGIILGSNLSLVLIVLLWKPYYTFSKGLKAPCAKYYFQYFLHALVQILCAYGSIRVINLLGFIQEDYFHIVLSSLIAICLFATTSFCIFYIFTKGMKMFTLRIQHIIFLKI